MTVCFDFAEKQGGGWARVCMAEVFTFRHAFVRGRGLVFGLYDMYVSRFQDVMTILICMILLSPKLRNPMTFPSKFEPTEDEKT